MSMILDALKKSESDRKGSENDPEQNLPIEDPDDEAPRSSRRLWIGVGVFCVLLLGAAAGYKILATGGPSEQSKSVMAKVDKTNAAAAPDATKTAPPQQSAKKQPPKAEKPVPQEPAKTEKPVETKSAQAPATNPVKTEAAKQAAKPSDGEAPAVKTAPAKTDPTPANPPSAAGAANKLVSPKPADNPAPAAPPVQTAEAPKAANSLPSAPAIPAPKLMPIAPLPPSAVPTPPPATKAPAAKPSLAGVTPPRKAKKPPAPRLSAAQRYVRGQSFERNGQINKAIAEYSAAIDGKSDYANAFMGRGWARVAKGDNAAAIRDFDVLLGLRPDSAEAHFARGWANEKAAQRAAAIADYSAAIELAPGYLDAHMSRGVLTFYNGDFQDAADDFAAVYNADQAGLGDFALIWEYVSDARSGTTKAQLDRTFSTRWHRTEWPGVIYAMLRGRATPDDVVQWTKNSDSKKQRENQCVAFFFLGQARLLAGDKSGAKGYFRQTLATGASSYRQYDAARVELARMSK